MSRYLARRIEQTEDVRVRHRTEARRLEALLDGYRRELAAADLDPLRLWQSFVHFKRLPTLGLAGAASAVFSARIEGHAVDFNSYMRSKERKARGGAEKPSPEMGRSA
jgi:hypothetical protein